MPRDLRARGLGAATKASTFSVAGFKGSQHKHGCVSCHCAYVCGCQTPETNRLCNDCHQGRLTYTMLGVLPKDCCRVRQKATRTERKSYALVGDTEWWFCTTCWRQFTEPGEEQ
jgi:hypothetical protein